MTRKKKRAKHSTRMALRYFYDSPTWWLAVILLVIWYLIPEYSGIKSVFDSIFGDTLLNDIMFYITGFVAAGVVFFIGVGIDDD